MHKPLTAENLKVDLTTDGRIVMEPQYLRFIRDNGYSVLGVEELHTVASEDSDKAHLVARVRTREKPDSHPELDYVADETTLWTCDCWSFRSGSADVSEGKSPTESVACKHIKRVSKVENAKADENQETLA